MKPSTISIAVVSLMTGCTIVPTGTTVQACRLLDAAHREADMPPAWYIQAGEVLDRCGDAEARERAALSACQAERRQGAQQDCEVTR